MISKTLSRPGRTALTAAAALLAFSGMCLAANFSADVVTKQAGMSMKGKCYVQGENARQEMSMGSQKRVIISRADKGVTWMISPAEKKYTEIPGVQSPQKMQAQLKKMAKEKYIGKEMLNGYACRKSQYTLPKGNPGTVMQWTSEKLNWPVKTEIKQGQGRTAVIEFKNIKEANQSSALFALPKGYKKTAMPTPPQMRAQPKAGKHR